MTDFHRSDDGPATKVYLTHSLLPNHIDPLHVSTKRKPFSTFHAQPFSHTLDLILPEVLYELVRTRLESEDQSLRDTYAKVHMKLGDVLQRDFFEGYIKKGNIMMRSEGRPLVDNVFPLYGGILRLELDRITYERCGLQGKPIEDGGKKHQKNRWVIEYDLAASSMTEGKKGFARLRWACTNVLNHSLTWLFYNFNPSAEESLRAGLEPISVHHPTIHTIQPVTTKLPNILVPSLTVADLSSLYSSEDSLALYEYFSLISLGSPRLGESDARTINSYLSRYEVPTFDGVAKLVTKNMFRVRWRGFIPPQFVRDLFLAIRKDALSGDKLKEQDASGNEEGRWIALAGAALGGGKSWTVMQWAGLETLVWEYDGC